MYDSLNAFCTHSAARLQGAPGGQLAGLTFAAKDLFDIAGHVTGAGNPDWLALHAPASRTAPVVQRLVDSGASMIGKTHTDELSRGILGENAHYGTPINPKSSGRVPADRQVARPLPSREGSSISRSAPTPGDRCAFRRAFVASMASAPRMDACHSKAWLGRRRATTP